MIRAPRPSADGRGTGGIRKSLVAAIALCLLATSCGGLLGGSGDERTVLVDFTHDEFATIMIGFFPGELKVTPGTTLVFKQSWTGEPHTVAGGTLVNEMMEKGRPLLDLASAFEELVASGVDLPEEGEEPDTTAAEIFQRVEAAEDQQLGRRFLKAYDALRAQAPQLPDRNNLGDTTNADLDEVIGGVFDEFFENVGLPWALDENEQGEFGATQNAGQPCYLEEGEPPEDSDTPCGDEQQRQPDFDGNASYYNSGLIPYEGAGGNTFRVPLSDDIDPGTYYFYCAVHGPDQSTKVTVRPEGSDIPSQADVSRRAREEIDAFAKPMVEVWGDGRDGEVDIDGDTVEGPFGGLLAPVHGSINEFVPRTISTTVGEEVTWKVMGWDHSVSFGVPEYFPIMRFADDGMVSLNPQLDKPIGGHPEIPEQEGEGIQKIDGGTYDGSGFYSSGLFSGEPYAEYTLRFSEPGTYRYACLLHPPMVGTVEVTA